LNERTRARAWVCECDQAMEVTGKDRGMKRPLEVGDRITKK